MYDRVSEKPGRALITPEDGSTPFYATVTMADEPTQKGTPPTKANLLTDETAALFGLGEDATVNDVLKSLIRPEIHIETWSGATITASNGQLTLSPKEDNGKWLFELPSYGTWIVRGTYQTLEREVEVDVDTVKRYYPTFNFVDDTSNWSANTWEQISVAIKTENIPDGWKNPLRDDGSFMAKMLTTSEGVSGSVYCIGYNHDTYTSGGVAPMTFMWIPSNANAVKWNNVEAKVDWADCSCRTVDIPNLVLGMDAAVYNAVAPIDKLTKQRDGTVATISEHFTLPSISELVSSSNYPSSVVDEGAKYEYLESLVLSKTGNAAWSRTPAVGVYRTYDYRRSGSQTNGYYINFGDVVVDNNSRALAVIFCF